MVSTGAQPDIAFEGRKHRHGYHGGFMRDSANQHSGRHPFHVILIASSLGVDMVEDDVVSQLKLLHISLVPEADVYRGLASLGRMDVSLSVEQALQEAGDELLGVVVCVDELATAEYEFFELASRFTDTCGVYVYSRCGDIDHVQRAISHGATGEVCDEVLAAFDMRINATLARDSKTSTPTVVEPIEPEVSEPTLTSEVETVAPKTQDQDLANDVDIDEDDDLIGPVQVPWSRNDSSGSRSAPPQRSAPTPDIKPADRTETNKDRERSPSTIRPIHKPLLTAEELRALIGENEPDITHDDRPQSEEVDG